MFLVSMTSDPYICEKMKSTLQFHSVVLAKVLSLPRCKFHLCRRKKTGFKPNLLVLLHAN